MGVGRIFSEGDTSGFFQVMAKGGANSGKTSYSNTKLREKHVSTKKLLGTYETSKSGGTKTLPPFRRLSARGRNAVYVDKGVKQKEAWTRTICSAVRGIASHAPSCDGLW